MRHGQSEVYGRHADLRRQAKPHDDARDHRVPQSPLDRHPVHEVQRGYGHQPKHDVEGEEVAELDVDDRQRRQRRREQPLPPAVQPRAEKVREEHHADVGQSRYAAPDGLQVVHFAGNERLRDLEQVQGKAAVREPSRMQGAFVRVEQGADVADRGKGQRLDPEEYRALVRVRRIAVPLVPIDSIQPQGQRHDQDGRKRGGDQHAPPVKGPDGHGHARLVGRRLRLRILHERLLYRRGKTYGNAPQGFGLFRVYEANAVRRRGGSRTAPTMGCPGLFSG